MLVDEHFELPNELTVPTQGEVCLDAQLERSQAKLLEAKDLRLDERLAREVGESRPAPEAERIVEQSRSLVGLGLLCLLDELLEAEEVELVGCDPDQISGITGDERLARAKRLPQPRDVELERVGGGPGRTRSPELVDEAIVRDDLVRTSQQNGEKRPLSRSAERQQTPFVDDLERSQDPELHRGLRRRR
jgi:hypothetical protein